MNLPKTIPGLLRLGSVVLRADYPPDHQLHHPRQAVVTRLWDRSGHPMVDVCDNSPDRSHDVSGHGPADKGDLRWLALDLSDATGRAHAAWWYRFSGPHYGRVRHSESGVEIVHNGRWLAGIDIKDPRSLPDGSCWMDAEVLRLVCLHVAVERHPSHPAVEEWRKALAIP